MSEKDNKLRISVDFMLKEYDRINNAMMDETSQAEQRVTFFLSISSAAVAIIGITAQTSSFPKETIFFISEGVLAVLLLYAITILNRLNTRFVQIDAYKKILAEIQGFFSDLDPSIKKYLIARKNILQPKRHKSKLLEYLLDRLRGTLGDLMILSASLIISGMVLVELMATNYAISSLILWTCITFIVSTFVLNLIYDLLRPFLKTWES